MKKTMIPIVLAMLIASPTLCQENGERVVIPLTASDEPAFVRVELVQGSIYVEAHGGSEVLADISARKMESLGEEEESEMEEGRATDCAGCPVRVSDSRLRSTTTK